MSASKNDITLMPNQVLAPILRADGSLRYDTLNRKHFLNVFAPSVLENPGMVVILELCDQGMFHPLNELFGNIGLDRFSQARRAIGNAISDPRLTNSSFAPSLKRALLKLVKAMQDREPKARAADHLITQSDMLDQLAREILSLESRCKLTMESRRQQAACRQDFWRLWELAWAARIFSSDDRVIESLEKMYARFSCLELREGERRKLQLPCGLRDPRIQEEGAIELW